MWKRTGNFIHHLKQKVSDGDADGDGDNDGEKIRPCQAKSKVGTNWRAGKIMILTAL
jgi:hypothetical protein